MTTSQLQIIVSIAVAIGIIIAVWIGTAPIYREKKKRLGRYWNRSCTGRAWVKRFPRVPKEDIREFLEAFVDGFAFDTNKRLKFEPDDKVTDVYTALYPSTGCGDALEVETFVTIIKKKYGVDLAKVGNPDITLGQIFEMTRNPNQAMEATS